MSLILQRKLSRSVAYFSLSWFIFFLSYPAYSQKTSGDTVYYSTHALPDDSAKFEKLIGNIQLSMRQKDFHLTDQLFEETVLYLERTGYPSGISSLCTVIDKSFLHFGNYQKALDYKIKLKDLAEKKNFKADLQYIYGTIGNLYWFMGDHAKALEHYRRQLEINESGGTKKAIAGALNNLGLVYRGMNQNKKASEYYYKSLILYLEINDTVAIANCYNNIGVLYYKQKDYTNAIDFAKKSLELRVKNKDSVGIATSLGNLGGMYSELKQFREAETFLLESFKISKKIKDIEGIYEVGFNLYELYEWAGKHEEALRYYKEHVEAKSILSNEEAKREAVRNEMELKFAQEMQKKNLLDEAEKRKQKIYITSALIILLIVSVFSVVLYKRFRITKKQKYIIESKNKEIVDSINYARRIQYSLLAQDAFLREQISEHFVLFKPKDIVSGDFYWATSHRGRFYLAVCDSTGHGVPGAFMCLLNIGFLSEAINEKNIEQPHEVLNYVRNRLINGISKEGQRDGFDGILLCFDPEKKKISYAAANNHPHVSVNGRLTELPCDKMPVGIGEKTETFTLHEVPYVKDQSIYLFTDGYSDQFGGPKGKKFKYKKLQESLADASALPLNEQSEFLDNIIEQWRGELEQVDDILVVGVKI